MTTCYGCLDRHEGCHADCERYLQQKEAFEIRKAEREREKENQRLLLRCRPKKETLVSKPQEKRYEMNPDEIVIPEELTPIIRLFLEFYKMALHSDWVNHKASWALYQTWKESSRQDRRARNDITLEMPTYSDMEIGREK